MTGQEPSAGTKGAVEANQPGARVRAPGDTKTIQGKASKDSAFSFGYFMGDITSRECRLWNTVNENRTLISHITQVCTIPGQIFWILLHFYWKNPAMHLLYASPFIRIWKRLVSPDSVSPGEGIPITVLNKNPVVKWLLQGHPEPGRFPPGKDISLVTPCPVWSELGPEPSSSVQPWLFTTSFSPHLL